MFIVVNNIHPAAKMRNTVRSLLAGVAVFNPLWDDKFLNMFNNKSRYVADVNTMHRRRYKLDGVQWTEDQVVMATDILTKTFGIDNVKIIVGKYEHVHSVGVFTYATYVHINFKDVVICEAPEITSQKAANKAFREFLAEVPMVTSAVKCHTVRKAKAHDAVMLNESWHAYMSYCASNGTVPSTADWSLIC